MYWCVVCNSKPAQEHSGGFDSHLKGIFAQKAAWSVYIHIFIKQISSSSGLCFEKVNNKNRLIDLI